MENRMTLEEIHIHVRLCTEAGDNLKGVMKYFDTHFKGLFNRDKVIAHAKELISG